MQNTSALYNQIIESPLHFFETKVVVNGNDVNQNNLFSVDRSRPGVGNEFPSIGSALSATLTMTMLNQSFTIPEMAEIKVYCRAVMVDDSQQTRVESEWLSQGTYYIDTRELTEANTLVITAYDAMLKAEKQYPSTNHAWPYSDIAVVREIAADIGCTVDSRTVALMTADIMISLPASYTEREVLSYIASAYSGNFVITDENALLLVPLYGNNDDFLVGNYLADDDGTTALLFGNEGWFILV